MKGRAMLQRAHADAQVCYHDGKRICRRPVSYEVHHPDLLGDVIYWCAQHVDFDAWRDGQQETTAIRP